ncbi:hypothetical protein E2562_012877 [Oryza meyeriana var. granulata]|uniref:Uncharacterized protein n=1 Tax=Oryza meyeriana var. granulata TaxID=110450 RepID=A0A6G1CPR1_9ORYZ|nr:hypothetical protein E2562_012877 [Oryza meyeriana var. granulata]
MTPLYALCSSPTALPPPSVHIHPTLLETKAAPRLAPDSTAPTFGLGFTSVAALTRAPARDPYSPFLPGTLAASGEPSRATYLAAFKTLEAPSTVITTTTGSVMVTSSNTIAGTGSSTPAMALGSASAPPEMVLDKTPASPRTAARVAPFLLGTAFAPSQYSE